MLKKLTLPLSILLITPLPVLAHADEAAEGGETAVIILTLLSVSAILYWRRSEQIWRRLGKGRGIGLWHPIFFVLAMGMLGLALASPIEQWSGELFAAHMVQHVLLLMGAAPLLVLATPPATLAWLMPERWRRPFALRLHQLTRRLRHGATWPLLVWLLYALSLWIWHIPALYQTAVTQEWVHGLEHTSFLGTALLFWWTLAHSRGRRFYSVGLLFIFTTALHSGLLGVLLTFARHPIYPIYTQTRPTLNLSLTPLADQQAAGAIMWVIAGVVYIIAMLILLNAWLLQMEKHQP